MPNETPSRRSTHWRKTRRHHNPVPGNARRTPAIAGRVFRRAMGNRVNAIGIRQSGAFQKGLEPGPVDAHRHLPCQKADVLKQLQNFLIARTNAIVNR